MSLIDGVIVWLDFLQIFGHIVQCFLVRVLVVVEMMVLEVLDVISFFLEDDSQQICVRLHAFYPDVL